MAEKRFLRRSFSYPRVSESLGYLKQVINPSRVSDFFLKLLILLLPVQIGKHFWPSFAYLWSLPIDYFSPTLYLTDVLILGAVFFKILDCLKKKKLEQKFNVKGKRVLFKVVACLGFLFFNLLIADNWGLALYKIGKFTEFLLLGIYILFKNQSLKDFRRLVIFPIIYSSLIAWGQFYKQASLGGWFWWLGERVFSLQTPGIAKSVVGSKMFLRSYATFPHPHLLASFLLVCLVLVVPVLTRRKTLFLLLIVIPAIVFTFSRYTWLTCLLLGGGLLIKKTWRTRFFIPLLIVVIVLGLVFWARFKDFLSPDIISFQRRWWLSLAALAMIKDNSITGVGMGNFLLKLVDYWPEGEVIRFLQPVHNIYLLVLSQIGVIGGVFLIGLFFKLILKVFSRGEHVLGISLLVISFTGLFDHHWLTLQQSQILFTFVLAWSVRAVVSVQRSAFRIKKSTGN
ncbi:O-antigen ligase family protein [Patescibacteria group bacterium]